VEITSESYLVDELVGLDEVDAELAQRRRAGVAVGGHDHVVVGRQRAGHGRMRLQRQRAGAGGGGRRRVVRDGRHRQITAGSSSRRAAPATSAPPSPSRLHPRLQPTPEPTVE